MSGILTILNCGTSYNRESGDIIGELALKNYLNPVKDLGRNGRGRNPWIINAGPGGGTIGKDMPGSRKIESNKARDLFNNYKPFIKGPKMLKLLGGAAGYGMQANVVRSIMYIEDQVKKPEPITKVVLVGWSRGAVTCHMIAHAMANYSKDLKLKYKIQNLNVSIFAFDPVAGGDPVIGSAYWDKSRTTLPKNVKRYLAIYSAHETRYHYKPVQFKKGDVAQIDTIIMPGEHKTMVVEKDNSVPEITLISKALCHQFLLDEGIVFHKSPYKISPFRMLEYYDIILGSASEVKKLRGGKLFNLDPQQYPDRGILWRKKNRSFNKNKNKDYIVTEKKNFIWKNIFSNNKISASIFVNEHHKRLFQRFFPIGLPWRKNHFILLEDLPNVSLRLKIAKQYSEAAPNKMNWKYV